jgi:hypothetical protein
MLQAAGEAALHAWRARLGYYVYETVGALRIADMFDIVVDYPDRRGGCVGRCLRHRVLALGQELAVLVLSSDLRYTYMLE